MSLVPNYPRFRRSLPASTAAAFIAVATGCAAFDSASAAATTAPQTCESIKQKCVSRVAHRMKTEKPDGIERPHLTFAECDASYHEAEKTGVWPEHLPLNFAVPCTP